MQEILFRAKKKYWSELQKEDWWVEGYLVKYQHCASKEEYVYGIVPTYASALYIIEIDSETLCQYTGLKDKDGNRIWENDIVRCNRREKKAIYKVIWDKTYADFRIEKLNGLGIILICIEEGNIHVFGRHYNVIGNIFDNSELLEES